MLEKHPKSRMEIIKEVAKKKGIKVIDVPLGVFHLDEYSLWAPAEVIAICQRIVKEGEKRFKSSLKRLP